MKVACTIENVRSIVTMWKEQKASVGLVPTMGFLHEGHESLIRQAARENRRVVVSIFVNPTQFGPTEDLDSYPRDLERDLAYCKALGVDMVFTPSVEEMYSSGFQTSVSVSSLARGLCGKSRPTHFQGVCTVVSKLFNIVTADRAYFGQKDAQQLAIIRRMTKDLNFNLEIVGCPIIREPDGLAKSSRNKYLTKEERKAAPALRKALCSAEQAFKAGTTNTAELRRIVENRLAAEPLFRMDYIEFVDASSLEPVETVNQETLLAAAAFLGTTRIIDNCLLDPANTI